MGADLKVGGELKHADTRQPDFSGWATKAGLKCKDGRTITGGAFAHQDGQQVPLVYHHTHDDVSNVLGHVILHDRGDEGVYCDGYFNSTPNGQTAKLAVEHGDLKSLSIFANELMERAKNVMHGVIKEVSLVLAGANPGALIDNVQLAHGDRITQIDDEAIIYIGEDASALEHSGVDEAEGGDNRTIQDVLDTLDDAQSAALEHMLDAAAKGETINHADAAPAGKASEGKTVKDIYNAMTDEQKSAVDFMVGAALDGDGTEAKHTAADDNDAVIHSDTDPDKGELIHMNRNVFDQTKANELQHTNIKEGGLALSHADLQEINELGKRRNSMKAGLEEFLEKHQGSLAHGIHNIEQLFPEARNFTQTPEWDKRRTEWVKRILDKVTKSPFSRIRTRTANLTQDEARAKGYIKGHFKKEEWFSLTHRATTPTTVYKKQQLDRDDIVDIVDFDVVLWMKGEMRLMLEEELARAILIGDGRSGGDEDKIRDPMGASEGAGIRSILHDDDLYAKTEYIKVPTENAEYGPTISDRILESMTWFKGTPGPTFYTTLPIITRIMLTRDGFGHRLWSSWDDFAKEIGCVGVETVESAEDEDDLVGIIVNLTDYALGNDRGGEVNLFDDFDIDYNQFKYLIETRLSGALTKIRSAVIIRLADAGDVEVVPQAPQFNKTTGVLTPATTTGVTYKRADTDATVTAGSPITLSPGQELKIYATPNTGYFFRNNQNDEFTFKRDAS